MTSDRPPEISDPPPYGVGTYLVPVFIGVGYFVLLAMVVSLGAPHPWTTRVMTIIHGALLSTVTTWLWLPQKQEPSVTSQQFTLGGFLGIIAVAAICISFAAQATRRPQAGFNSSPLAVIPAILFFSLMYFVFSLPFATFLGVGLFRIGQIVMRIRRE